MKIVYTCFCTDVIHEGHMNIIHEAKKYGRVVVGVLSDEASIRFNRFPGVSFTERINMVKSIPGVDEVIIQNKVMYDEIIEKLHPDYVIHGDNWLEPPMRAIRDNVSTLLKKYGGKIIDVPYTYSEEIRHIDAQVKERLAMPEYRRKRLHQLLQLPPLVKAIEVHRENHCGT